MSRVDWNWRFWVTSKDGKILSLSKKKNFAHHGLPVIYRQAPQNRFFGIDVIRLKQANTRRGRSLVFRLHAAAAVGFVTWLTTATRKWGRQAVSVKRRLALCFRLMQGRNRLKDLSTAWKEERQKGNKHTNTYAQWEEEDKKKKKRNSSAILFFSNACKPVSTELSAIHRAEQIKNYPHTKCRHSTIKTIQIINAVKNSRKKR